MLNADRLCRDIIVIGASAGGVETLYRLFQLLTPQLAASIAVVQHRSPHYKQSLAEILGRTSGLPILEPQDSDGFVPGKIYIAPTDMHMILEHGHLRLTRDPTEHGLRPAIDPLFRSAAQQYGKRVVGLVLSGTGEDGVSGLVAIKAEGGLNLVQDPAEAIMPYMPQKAIRKNHVDARLRVQDIPHILLALSRGEAVASPS
jgi:two-component system chemotaxis response regulator CheB